jgi:hypothetical protein
MKFLTKYENLQSFMLAIRPLEENDKTYEKWDNCNLNILEQRLAIRIGLQFFYLAISYYKLQHIIKQILHNGEEMIMEVIIGPS